ncbi:DUF2071 domain-containing protein [Flammeovirga sp. SubArs3]|uniref:DUF2071 domain-containing protein n=1 Tax=Flammeovirga sp. SubArs3 TaxID=2995316 RepID=UPI00248CE6F3|nr:DUF2071 domain-containing protein [Flammeovirga sp. SubArs3]
MISAKTLQERITQRPSKSGIDVNTMLEHFAIISYKVPIRKIEHLIPKPFKLWSFKDEAGDEFALVSVVPFKDIDFHFCQLFPFLKFNFFQTNFRTYVIDERDGSYAAWFFGTTLGSVTHILPKYFWNMPWEYGKYSSSFEMEGEHYRKYQVDFSSSLGKGQIDLIGTTKEMNLLEGFKDLDEQYLILTHPVKGYYNLPKEEVGTYEIWHPKFSLYQAKPQNLYFGFLEKLGFLSLKEMNNPHSVLITNQIEFDIFLPPMKLKIY